MTVEIEGFQDVTLPHGRILAIAQNEILFVGQFVGTREGLADVLAFAELHHFTAIRFLTFRKSMLSMLHEEAARFPQWDKPEIPAYVVEVKRV